MRGPVRMKTKSADISNIYRLDGRVPAAKAIPFGLQHILAMFVANIAPILIVAGVSGLSSDQSGKLIQSAMIIAGIGTLVQLFPLWRIGSGLPIVMGISFTFVSVCCYIGPAYRRRRHRLLPALRGRGILRRRQRQRDVRLPSEPDPRNRDIAVLHPVQHLCEVLLEAALRPFRTDRRLYFGYFYGDG